MEGFSCSSSRFLVKERSLFSVEAAGKVQLTKKSFFPLEEEEEEEEEEGGGEGGGEKV